MSSQQPNNPQLQQVLHRQLQSLLQVHQSPAPQHQQQMEMGNLSNNRIGSTSNDINSISNSPNLQQIASQAARVVLKQQQQQQQGQQGYGTQFSSRSDIMARLAELPVATQQQLLASILQQHRDNNIPLSNSIIPQSNPHTSQTSSPHVQQNFVSHCPAASSVPEGGSNNPMFDAAIEHGTEQSDSIPSVISPPVIETNDTRCEAPPNGDISNIAPIADSSTVTTSGRTNEILTALTQPPTSFDTPSFQSLHLNPSAGASVISENNNPLLSDITPAQC